jgi:thiol-disulfide isomerase/thioredoxin
MTVSAKTLHYDHDNIRVTDKDYSERSSSIANQRSPRNSIIPQTTITSVQQFHDVLASLPVTTVLDASKTPLVASAMPNTFHMSTTTYPNNSSCLILVKFHASWCKSCQKVGYKLDQLVSELSHRGSSRGGSTGSSSGSTAVNMQQRLHILHVDYSTVSNRDLFTQYNITQLPTIQIYEVHSLSSSSSSSSSLVDSTSQPTLDKVLDVPCPPYQFYKVRDWMISYWNDAAATTKEAISTRTNDDDENTSTTISESTRDTSTLDLGHDMIESTVLPIILQGTTTSLPNKQKMIT